MPDDNLGTRPDRRSSGIDAATGFELASPDQPDAPNIKFALARNAAFAAAGGHEGAVVFPNLGLFVITCLDPRVDRCRAPSARHPRPRLGSPSQGTSTTWSPAWSRRSCPRHGRRLGQLDARRAGLVAIWNTVSPVAASSSTCSSRDVSRDPDGDGGWRSTSMSARWRFRDRRAA